jgi:hypothetical protein
VRQLGLYKTSLYFKGKDAMIKDFKLENLICFNSSIIKKLNPLTPNTPYFPPHSSIELSNFFMTLEALGERLQMFFELHKQNNNV